MNQIININNKKCVYCKRKLNKKNISKWQCFVSSNEVGNICVLCAEIKERHISSCIIENNICISTRSEKEIKKEILKEGWTDKTLQIKEESLMSITQ